MSTENEQGSKEQDRAPGGPSAESPDEINRHPVNQGGHAGMHGHGGQQSGGMGGEHGGDLHDIGSAQSGMTGRGGMGGNDADSRQGDAQMSQQAGQGARQAADDASYDEYAEVQQSAQREGMGHHHHTSRNSEQALDADDDVDKTGTHHGSAGRSQSNDPV